MAPLTRVRRVDDDGIGLLTTADHPIDVCLDGRRVWTFWSLRDTDGTAAVLRRVAWPATLARHLHGHARVVLRDSATGQVFWDREQPLGDAGQDGARIAVRNPQGVELGIDKSGKLVPTFAGRSRSDIASLVEATASVIEALQQTGIEPFLAYGTLLGAVREGAVLGHDSDADLGYVSTHTDPVDVCRESYAVQRVLNAQGWRTTRYSGAAFKVLVTEADVTRGLDVFGGFLDGGRLHLMGEIGEPFERSWIFPLGTATLEGREMPVPAEPERLLAATYGPGWRVPDPAFQFTTPDRTIRELEDWFRGTQPMLRFWERRSTFQPAATPPAPSVLAKRAAALAAKHDAEVLDVGAGRGWDSLWMARQGVAVRSLDYTPRALEHVARTAAAEELDLEVRHVNLTELRSTLAEGARLAHDPRPRVVVARHLLDATSAFGRESFVRLCSMALREGGWLLADVHVVPDAEPEQRAEWMVGRVDVDNVATLLRGAGAVDVTIERLSRKGRPTVRILGKWDRCS
ncbi:class I SAM-dependent methyltransferase [Nocardioides sp. AX2bis]|uniref:class I SAM-dependent methyltransferase n=1 Tax=Nocardioides sp. AX2bis TaxID=2653157 RepID=UPI0012F1B516|nr:class I SAM-dependent methyltransferase [Nocardioides sp. AX2bis]VXB12557.1 Methyltransferase domain-containing protein [Nocardioides sp. AX2bis]